MTIDRGLQMLPGAIAYSLSGTRLAELMVESGFNPDPSNQSLRVVSGLPWQGSMPEIEGVIEAWTKRRDAARADIVQAQANLEEALLPDDERARRVVARNALPTRKTRGDGSQDQRYPDGRIVEVAPPQEATANGVPHGQG